jgi:G3E family GTPase
MSAAWAIQLSSAEVALADCKLFDGMQFINSCVEAYGTECGLDGAEILKSPSKFAAEAGANLSAAQKANFQKIFEVRGDIVAGLGASKRAVTDYAAAQALAPAADEGLAAKQKAAEEAAKGPPKLAKIPVTVITGFLGSGKTTLLNRILQENHGKRIAVIENEFGEVGIDDALIESGAVSTEENIVEMNNGCICCTVRGDLIAGLQKLVKNSEKSGKPLDGVIIETTGLADPAPVAQTFFADDFVQKKLALDGILTVTDAKHLVMHLDEEKPEGVENEAVEQVAFADRILLNKCDLVDEAQLKEVERRIKMINETVQIKRTQFSEVDMNFILGIQAFDLDKILEMDDGFLADDAEHQHDDRVTSVGLLTKGEVDNKRLNDWIGKLLTEKGTDIFRTKGVLAVQGMSQKFVFQAVHMAFAGAPQRDWAEGEERICKLTFIGKKLNREELEGGFKACLV